jgi:poly(3-hydroxybutyrate) depolymerase
MRNFRGRILRVLAKKAMMLVRAIAGLALAGHVAAAAVAASPALPAYGADSHHTSVSGLSSGAFMAAQLQVAYSRSIVGAGIVAGGPYYCAAGSLLNAEICMGQVPLLPPNPFLMAEAARRFARAHQVDALSNLARRHIYLFSGTDDSIVRQPAVDAAASFFRQAGVKEGNIKYVNDVPAGHAIITPAYGNACSANAAPYLSHCLVGGENYDQAGAILQHIHGVLNARVDVPAGQIVTFDQRTYAAASTGMADSGYLYVPQICTTAGARCKVHVALHGCMQSAESVGNQFYVDAGYNNWADSNRILVLYPQVNKSDEPYNPQGCWDWWGYTGDNYAYRSSRQMKAIMAMVKRLTKSH